MTINRKKFIEHYLLDDVEQKIEKSHYIDKHIKNTIVEDTKIDIVTFANSVIYNVDFNKVVFETSTFISMKFMNVTFTDCQILSCNFSACTFIDCDFTNSQLNSCKFIGSNFLNTTKTGHNNLFCKYLYNKFDKKCTFLNTSFYSIENHTYFDFKDFEPWEL